MKRTRAWMLVVVVAACGGDRGGGEPPGLVTRTAAAPKPIDPGRATRDGAELARAVAQPWQVAAAALGPHRLTVDSTVIVKDGATVIEELGEHTVIESAATGEYHATAEHTAANAPAANPPGANPPAANPPGGYGREVVWVGGRLYLRPRYALWHGRAPETVEEPAAIRDQLAAVLADYLDLVARGLEVSDKGAMQAAGRSGHRIELKLAPSQRAAAPATVSQRAWRDRATVTAISGEVVLDDALGVALAATLAGEVDFDRDGKRLTMAVTVKHTVEVIAAPTIAPPAVDQVVTAPTRSREVDDRNALLRGIAPPQGKAAVDDSDPASGSGAASGSGSAAPGATK